MAFFEFPHTRTYDSDLAWLIRAYKILTGKVNNIEQTIEDTINDALQGEELKQLITQMIAEALPLNVKYPPAESGLTPAVGDGETDDTAALQAMIAYANVNNMPMIFPAGVYRVSGLNVNVDTVFQGFDATLMLAPVSASPLINLTANLATSGLTLNGNLGGQTTAQNVINIVNGSFAITNSTIMGCKSCIEGTLVGDSIIGDSYLRNYQEYGIHAEGTGSFAASNVVVPSVASGGAMRFMRIDCNNCSVSNFSSQATVPIGFEITGDNNAISANIPNAETPVNDSGSGNTWTISGKDEKRYFKGDASINADQIYLEGTDVQLNPNNPLTYKTPTPLNNFFKKVPFKDASGSTYDVLVAGEQIEAIGFNSVFATVEEAVVSEFDFKVGDSFICLGNNGQNVQSNWKVVEHVADDLMHKTLANGLSMEFMAHSIINVLALGIPNNESDVSSTIQWLLDNGYRKLFFPEGHYKMGITIKNSNTVIVGAGVNVTQIINAGAQAEILFDCSGGRQIVNCYIGNLSIYGGLSDYVGIQVRGTTNNEWVDQSIFENLVIQDGYNAIRWEGRGIWNVFNNVWCYGNLHEGMYVEPSSGLAFNHNLFNNCVFRGNRMAGIIMRNADAFSNNTNMFLHCNIESNFYEKGSVQSGQYDCEFLNCNSLSFDNCYIENGLGEATFSFNSCDVILNGGSSLIPNSPLMRVVGNSSIFVDNLHGHNCESYNLLTSDSLVNTVVVLGKNVDYTVNEGVTKLWPTS